MEKSYSKKDSIELSKIIIIEGFWRIGKTTIANYLARRYGYALIGEPNHLNFKIKNGISKWYYKKHKERHQKAIKQRNDGKLVVMDRSILSNIAFTYAKTNKLPSEFKKQLKNIKKLNNFLIIFLYTNKAYAKNKALTVKDFSVKEQFLKNVDFYSNYLYFYKNILPPLINNKILFIKVDKMGRLKKLSTIMNLVKDKIANKNNNKIKETCASSILFYKNKFLLLYDHKWKYYVLPQGHKKIREKLSETALREAGEETGYRNLKLITRLGKYQYHFKRNKNIVYKVIQPYLIKISTISKIKKDLRSHEKYSNRFLSFEDAVRKLRWRQDKNLLNLSKKYLIDNKNDLIF
jgi:thymidylate kinase/ADP-ribose pyrophosphatase YjhB (NUDIX family)